MASTGTISEYFNKPVAATPKRIHSQLSSSDESPSPCSHQEKKRLNSVFSDLGLIEEKKDTNMQAALEQIDKRFESLSTKDDIREMKKELEGVFSKLVDRLEKIESRCFDHEKTVDALNDEINSMKKENESLKERLCQQEQRAKKVQGEQNEAEQYGRGWNLRLFKVAEKEGETAEQLEREVCRLFADQVKVPVTPADLDAVHRLGARPGAGGGGGGNGAANGRPRVVIVRFLTRKLRNRVFMNRKNLKGKSVSISEDLTAANAKLEKEAYKHSSTLSTWTSGGRIFAKLKNGKTVRLHFGDNINTLLLSEMK
jgi:uncharacterized coiled-coil protein SlyX